MTVRITFLGMLGEFSAIPLERLLAAGSAVTAVVVPSPSATTSTTVPIRVLDPPPPLSADLLLQSSDRPNIVSLAHGHAIPVLEVSHLRHPQTLSLLRALQPDLIVVACFPSILPKRLLNLPTHGCFNLHPSLLPKLRGPAPLFWTFQEGCEAGVTLHLMNERPDSGDIVSQMPLTFPDGISYAQAEHVCAQWGARLLVDALRAIHEGTLTTRPQLESEASYYASPSPEDFIITPEWSARRAFNFIRGIEGFGGPAISHVDDQRFVVREALEYKGDETLAEAYRIQGDELWLRCAVGVLHVRLSEH